MLYVHYSVIHSSQDVQSLRVCQRVNARVHMHSTQNTRVHTHSTQPPPRVEPGPLQPGLSSRFWHQEAARLSWFVLFSVDIFPSSGKDPRGLVTA